MRYFIALGDTRTDPDTYFEAFLPESPTVGQIETFKVVNCAGNDPGCPQPWSATLSPKLWIACHGETTNDCLIWELNYASGTRSYHEGMESTCGTISPTAKSRLDTTHIRNSAFRHLGNWANISSSGGVASSEIAKSPDPSSVFDIECCASGSTVNNGIERCNDPAESRYWMNSQTPTSSCN